MADLDLDRLEALAKAATPGPWRTAEWRENCALDLIDAGGARVAQADRLTRGEFRVRRTTFDFIAAANPAAVLALVARVRAAEARADKSALRSIEARNPGIDMDQVQAVRSAVPDLMAALEKSLAAAKAERAARAGTLTPDPHSLPS